MRPCKWRGPKNGPKARPFRERALCSGPSLPEAARLRHGRGGPSPGPLAVAAGRSRRHAPDGSAGQVRVCDRAGVHVGGTRAAGCWRLRHRAGRRSGVGGDWARRPGRNRARQRLTGRDGDVFEHGQSSPNGSCLIESVGARLGLQRQVFSTRSASGSTAIELQVGPGLEHAALGPNSRSAFSRLAAPSWRPKAGIARSG